MSASHFAANPSEWPAAANPFREAIAVDPWRPMVDVPEIGEQVFLSILERWRQVRQTGNTASMLLYGAPGSGKTHLLARLRTYLSQQDWQEKNTIFIPVRLDTSPWRLWRHLRQRTVEALMKPAGDYSGLSQLDWAICWRLASSGSGGKRLDRLKDELRDGQPYQRWRFASGLARMWSLLTPAQIRAHGPLYERLEGSEGMSRAIGRALFYLFHREHPSLASAWLRGESLDEEDLRRLRIPAGTEEGEEKTQEEESKEVVLSLLNLMPCTVLAFDQIEALETDADSEAGLKVFGKLVSDLHDRVERLLILSCVQNSYVPRLQGALEQPDFDRLALDNRALPPLSEPLAQKLVLARLNASAHLAPLRQGRPDPFWPLDWEEVMRLFREEEGKTARKLLTHCAKLFDRWRGGPPAPAPTDPLRDEWEERLQRALENENPATADAVLANALPYLAELSNARAKPGAGDVNWIWEKPGASPVRISFCNQRNLTALAARLRRLQEREKPGPDLVLIRHKDLPISHTARACRQRLKNLQDLGASFLRPSAEALAALDAMRELMADAKAGDLSLGGETVAAQSVLEWLREKTPEPLNSLADQICSRESEADPELRENLIELLSREKLLPVAEAARRLHCSGTELQRLTERNPALFGWLDGAPPVVFRVPGASRIQGYPCR
jgi:DNA polymerase III delta prime subunit